MKMFSNPFSFQGRIRRTEFGLSYIFFLVAFYLFTFLAVEADASGYGTILIIVSFYWFLLAQSAKRCHDMGQSGFYQLIPFYVFALLFSEGQRRNNKYGQDPKLVELQQNEIALENAKKPLWSDLPEGKDLYTIGSTLLSSVLLTSLLAVTFSELLSNYFELYNFLHYILVIAGYFTLLLVSYKREPLPQLGRYRIVHRAVFSVLFYLILALYEVLFVPGYSEYINWFAELIYIISIFILTYPALLIYSRISKKNQQLYAEA